MATVTTDTRFFQDNTNNNNKNNEVNRQEIQAAIAKAVELRALHAALMQANSPSNLKLPSSSSPASFPAPQFSAQDYPVFTPVSTNFSLYFIYLFIFNFYGRHFIYCQTYVVFTPLYLMSQTIVFMFFNLLLFLFKQIMIFFLTIILEIFLNWVCCNTKGKR